eukprot:scaffold11162_cov113-Isochrysis_galbana.AAC.5
MKNQTRIRKEFKTGSSHVATRLYTTSRPFLPLLGDYSRRCEGFKLADEMRSFRLELSDQVGTSSGKLALGLPGGFTSRVYPRHLTRYSIFAPLPRRCNNSSTRYSSSATASSSVIV